jgi:hypothetical protein
MNSAKFPMPKAGQIDDSLTSKIRSAEIVLASSPPTIADAIKEAQALASCFTQDIPDARLDAVVEIFRHFPLPIIRECTDRWSGIACQRVPDQKTGKVARRRFMPSNGEIKDWCEERVADLTKLVKGVHVEAERKREAENVRLPRTPEDVDYVRAKCAATIASLRRACGIPTPEEQRKAAADFLARLAADANAAKGDEQ